MKTIPGISKIIAPLILAVVLGHYANAADAPSNSKTNEAPPPATLEALQQRISGIITQPRYAAAMWGVKIVSLDSGKVWFTSNPEKLFSPASNSKLYTMALALDTLGPDYHFKTSLYSEVRPDTTGVLKGDLVIYGRGDPSISSEFTGGSTIKALEPLVIALTNAGVRQIEGDILGDESFLHVEPYGSGWSWEDMENYYGAEISALTLNANITSLSIKPGSAKGSPAQLAFDPPTEYIKVINHSVTAEKSVPRHITIRHALAQNTIVITGQVPMEEHEWKEDVTIHNPAGYFAEQFRAALVAKGITVKGGIKSVDWNDRQENFPAVNKWVELGSAQFQPFREIIRSVQKPSQNLYTDLILDSIGANLPVLKSNPFETSEHRGLGELTSFLKKAGVKANDTLFQDGSGLSRDNLTTPNATIALLTYMSKHKDFKTYYDALPIAGVDGTLRRRFKGTLVEGNLHGKTGTLHWANSLSGYMTNAAGENLAICFMLNRYQPAQTEGSKTHDMDEIVALTARTRFRTGP